MDLQDLFFDCIYSACKVKSTREQKKIQPNAKSLNVQQKTEVILDFITNKNVLNSLYDIMFRFQKVQKKVQEVPNSQSGTNKGFNLDLQAIQDEFSREAS